LELAIHLPLMEFGDEGQSLGRLTRAADAARECAVAALSANDHFLFQTPWLDGPTALAAVIDRSGAMELATTVSLVALRGPVPLAKTLAALDLLSDGRVIAGVGPGFPRSDRCRFAREKQHSHGGLGTRAGQLVCRGFTIRCGYGMGSIRSTRSARQTGGS
jgi:alkanesulfonate monooxygenase SsuD/methylene tetrahydromethanopterin reductase-like flavin-dependent oxidoreductase (luciferase family)